MSESTTIALTVETAISVASGRLLCDFTDVHDAVHDLAGWDVYTHHMADEALMSAVAAKVIRQVPWMPGAIENMPTWDALPPAEVKPAIDRWLARIRAVHGDEVILETGEPLPYMSPFGGLERLGTAR